MGFQHWLELFGSKSSFREDQGKNTSDFSTQSNKAWQSGGLEGLMLDSILFWHQKYEFDSDAESRKSS